MSPEGQKPSELNLPTVAAIIGGIYLLSNFALNKKQRQAILDRDNNTSQMRHYDERKGWVKGKPCATSECALQVHHIETQRNGGEDDPSNLITILECEHNGRCRTGEILDPEKTFIVHPDMPEVFQEYRKGNKNAFAQMFAKRNAKKEANEAYWNTEHDSEMAETASDNTKSAITKGWKWPWKR